MNMKTSSLLIAALFFFASLAFADGKKDDKKSNAIKTKVSEREHPPANDVASASQKEEAYDYMCSPKLEDCTKADFDRE